jgi:Uma2 family endonuclease
MSVSVSTWQASPPVTPAVRRFSVDEYHRMIDTGVLTENDPVELLEGWVVTKMARNPDHDITIELADRALRPRIGDGLRLRIQSAITTLDSEPEPDLAVARGPVRGQNRRHPDASELAMIIEVADTSLAHDRDIKGRVYARAGVAVYWIINLVDSQVEVYTAPSGPAAAPSYQQRQTYGIDEAVPLVIDGQIVGHVPVRELLP